MWFPKKPFPGLNNIDLLRATIEDAKVLLSNPPTETFASTMETTNRQQLIQFFKTINQHTHAKTKDTIPAPEIRAPSLGVPTQETEYPGPRRSRRLAHGISATAINPDTGKAAEYKELCTSTVGQRWELAMSKELGCLFRAMRMTPTP